MLWECEARCGNENDTLKLRTPGIHSSAVIKNQCTTNSPLLLLVFYFQSLFSFVPPAGSATPLWSLFHVHRRANSLKTLLPFKGGSGRVQRKSWKRISNRNIRTITGLKPPLWKKKAIKPQKGSRRKDSIYKWSRRRWRMLVSIHLRLLCIYKTLQPLKGCVVMFEAWYLHL